MSTITRVVKNTGFLYLRMGITVIISLYTTRLVLASLGEVDFGIFNVIGGSIAMLGFLNSTMANATQRFMSYAEGKGDLQGKTRVFNVSLVLHLIIGVLTILLLLSLMPVLFDNLLNIPPDRIKTAKYVYYSLIFSTFLTIINVPYDALMNAHENMRYYAVIGVVECILKLAVAFVCVYSTGDVLLIYSILTALIPLFSLSVMKSYCHRHYPECVFGFKSNWDYSLVKEIVNFSGWNFLTAISSLFTVQGLSVVLNHFYGSRLNASQGIANQVNGQLSSFSANMMKALNPVIVKKTAENDSISRITFSGCKFSAILVLLFAVPVIIKVDYILSIWLKDVPEWAALFCQLQLIHTVVIQIANPLSTAIYGNGDIKKYAIYKSITNFLPLILTIIAFRVGGSPIWLYIFYVIVLGVFGDFVIVHFAQEKCGLSIDLFIKNVVVPVVVTAIVMYVCGKSIVHFFPSENFLMLVVCFVFTTIGLLVSLCTLGLTSEEKDLVVGIMKKTLGKFIRRA